MGYLKKKKLCCKIFTNMDLNTYPPKYSNELREEWIKVSWFFIAQQNEVILQKGTIQLTCATFVTGIPAIHVLFCRNGKKSNK